MLGKLWGLKWRHDLAADVKFMILSSSPFINGGAIY